MQISINIIACLEYRCHIWVPIVIHHVYFFFFSFFSNAQSDSFRGVWSQFLSSWFRLKKLIIRTSAATFCHEGVNL
jgi:hypothetical protein